MKRVAIVSVVLILLAAVFASEGLAQCRYYYRGRGQYPSDYNVYSYYGNKIHHSPYGYPSWNYCPPRRYWYGPSHPYCPMYGCYPGYPYYYGGGFAGGCFRWNRGGGCFGIGF